MTERKCEVMSARTFRKLTETSEYLFKEISTCIANAEIGGEFLQTFEKHRFCYTFSAIACITYMGRDS